MTSPALAITQASTKLQNTNDILVIDKYVLKSHKYDNDSQKILTLCDKNEYIIVRVKNLIHKISFF